MKNLLTFRNLTIAAVFALLCFTASLLSDRAVLSHGLIRLHVVAASDSAPDQSVKLKVKDAVNAHLSALLSDCRTKEEAHLRLQENLEQLQILSDGVLRDSGFSETARVTLCREAFPIRDYETFRLPSGVYDSLRITIGPGQGHNWWCVVYPQLCNAATVKCNSADEAVSVGLMSTLSGKPGTEVRFYLLDKLGQLQNKWFTP